MATIFWSDTHFQHRGRPLAAGSPGGVIGYCGRPYASVEEMDADLIVRWNAMVGPRDTIYLLGDFGFGSLAKLQPIFAALQGHKRLVVGNHDERNPKVLKLGWESIDHLVTVREASMRAIACHYPLETWKNERKGYIMLHGHSHGTLKRVVPHRFDVGVDVRQNPVHFETLWQEAQAQTVTQSDHHGEESD
jgi:calcineurin-like phosphoesterase family protein